HLVEGNEDAIDHRPGSPHRRRTHGAFHSSSSAAQAPRRRSTPRSGSSCASE
ncbi:hypothetical protein H0H93_005273, partial [Arthromyces matolae]